MVLHTPGSLDGGTSGPPDLPLRIPAPVSWHVTSNPETTDASEYVVWTVQDGVVRFRSFREGSMQFESWLTEEGLEASLLANGDVSVHRLDVEESIFLDVIAGRFPELGWMRPAHYQGVVDFDGRSAHYYTTEERVLLEDEYDDAEGAGIARRQMQLWVDIESGLPIADTLNGVPRIYTFQHGKTSLEKPPAIREELQRIEAAMETYRRRHAMP